MILCDFKVIFSGLQKTVAVCIHSKEEMIIKKSIQFSYENEYFYENISYVKN